MIELLYFIPILLSAFAIGNFLFKFFKLKATYLEESIFSIVLGFAFYSYFTFFLGILGWLYAWIYLAVIGTILASLYKRWTLFLRKIFFSIKSFEFKYDLETFLIIVIAIFVILAILSTLVPPFLWDELGHDLGIPKLFVRHHAIIPNFSSWASERAYDVNMLYVIGILLKNGILAKFFALSNGLILMFSIYSFGRRFYNKNTGLLAAFIYITLPIILNHIGSAYIDISTALFVFLAFYSYMRWNSENMDIWLYLSAAMNGLALASKQTAFFPSIILGAFIIYSLIRKKDPKFVKNIFIFILIVTLFSLPWFIKSYIHTNNPIWPLAYGIFGGKYWDADLAAEFSKMQSLIKDEGVYIILRLPWDLTMNSPKYLMRLGWNSIFLAFIPLLIFFRKIEKLTLCILIYSTLSVYLTVFASYYFFGFSSMRYVMVYSTLALLSAVVIDKLYSHKLFKRIILIVFFSTFIFSTALWYGVFFSKLPVVFGLETEKQFYNGLKDNNGYDIYQFINKNTPKDSVVLIFRDDRNYLIDRDYLIGHPTDQKIIDFRKIQNEDQLYSELVKNGVTHIFINTKIVQYFPQETITNRVYPLSKKTNDIMENAMSKYAKPLKEENGIYLYELK